MIPPRKYEPKLGEVLYHYCTANTFLSVIKSGALRLTDLVGMNDFLEVKWGYKKFIETANKILNEVDKEFLDEIDKKFSATTLKLISLASCFSTDGDVLSQWRAYTSDGCGYAIGFNATMLTDLPIQPLRVCYDEEIQETEISIFLHEAFNIWKELGRKFDDDLARLVIGFCVDTCAYKNPAFVEEQEIRLVHVIETDINLSTNKIGLKDSVGTKFGIELKPEKINHFLSGDLIRFYLDVKFNDWASGNPINEIVLGPKNPNLEIATQLVVDRYGFKVDNIRRSKASYK